MNSDNKYNNGKIYTIRCIDNNNLIYVGSTIQPLYKRWYEHKQLYNKEGKQYNKLLYIKMRELGFDKFYIELYENINCENIEQLHKKEGEIIRQIATLNKNIAYNEKTREARNIKEKQWNEKKVKNKEFFKTCFQNQNDERVETIYNNIYGTTKENLINFNNIRLEYNYYNNTKKFKSDLKSILKESKMTIKKPA